MRKNLTAFIHRSISADSINPERTAMQFSEVPANPDYESVRGSRPINLALSALFSIPVAWALLYTPRSSGAVDPPAGYAIQLRDDPAMLKEPLFEVIPGAPGEAGGSNRRGNGAIDRILLETPNPPIPPGPPLPTVDLQTQSQTTPYITLKAVEKIQVDSRPLPPLEKALPIYPGGNGAFQGDGEGLGRGHGDGFGDGQGGGGLTVLKAPTLTYYSKRGDPPLTGNSVRVRLLVGADGIPTDARVIFGPAHIHEAARKVTLEWRFQVPKALKPKAPIPVFIEIRFKTTHQSI